MADDGTTTTKTPTWVWIVLGVMAVVIVILIIVLVMQMNGKKKCEVGFEACRAKLPPPAGIVVAAK